MNKPLLVITLVAIAGIALYWRKKRKFNRINEHGIERHDTYLKKVKAEGFDSVLAWVGGAAILGFLYLINPANLAWLLLFALIGLWWKYLRRR